MDRDILHCTIIKAFALMDAFDVANAPKTRPHSIRTERESQKRGIPERNINLPGTSAMENNERLVVIMGCGSRPLRALSNGSTSPLWDKQGGAARKRLPQPLPHCPGMKRGWTTHLWHPLSDWPFVSHVSENVCFFETRRWLFHGRADAAAWGNT